MKNLSRRGAVRLIGMAMGSMTTYRINATVTFRKSIALAGSDGEGWQALNMHSTRYLTLDATVNGFPVKAVVDSGASRSVINTELAIGLSLPVVGALNAAAFTKEISGTLYKVRELKVGTVAIWDTDVASFDLSGIEGGLAEKLPLLIGQDILEKSVLEIQFTKDLARLVSKPRLATDQFELIPITRSGSRLPLITLNLGHQAEAQAIFDLGSDVICAISEDFATEHRLTAGRRTSTTLTVGAEGESINAIFCLPQMRLGSFTLHQVPVCIVKDWKLSAPVNLGWPFFVAFDVVLDMKEKSLLLHASSEQFADDFPKDRSGIGAVRLPDGILVRYIAVNSPAEHAGLRPGDKIVALDGVKINSTYPAAGARLGSKQAGTRLLITLADGRSMELILADYF